MSEEEFNQFAAMAMNELQTKQQRLAAEYRLFNWARWAFDQSTGKLRFENERGQTMVDADTLYVGSYSQNSGSWKWAWANFNVAQEDRAKSEEIRKLAKITGYDIFDYKEQLGMDEQLAFQLTAMALHHLKADGFYRIPNRDPETSFFLGLRHIRRHHTDLWPSD